MVAPVGRGAGSTSLTAPHDRDGVYAIDTPPLTASGTLHLGHAFSFTHTDFVARFQRMRGKEVFYPIGWDDNGLPTERRVQNYYGVRCDPSLPYDPALSYEPHRRAAGQGRPPVPVSRRNFVELCLALTGRDEQAYEGAWRRLGLSVDWSTEYQTIGRPVPGRGPARLPAQPGPRRGVPGRGAVAVGRDVRHRGGPGRAGGPAGGRGVPPGGVPPGRRR